MPPDVAEMTLRDYANVVIRRKWIVVAATLLTTVIAVAMSALQSPVYSTDAEVLIQPRGQDGLFADQIQNLNDRAIQTEIQVIEGQNVRIRVQSDLGLDELPAPVNASSVGSTDVISLRMRSGNAANAAVIANAYTDAYIDIRREQSVAELLAASSEVQTAITELQTDLDSLGEDDPRRGSIVAQIANFTTTLDQLNVDAALRTGGATIIKSAERPTSPVEPTPARTATLAFIVGLLLGLGAAFLVDYLDDKVRSADDIERATNRTVIAEVPVDRAPDDRPLAMTDPTKSSVEAYRGLRTNLQFLALDQELKTIQFTSSLAGEGKTTTATNVAVVLARAGHRVAIVDADLRRPRIHQVFGLPSSPGLTDVLLGESPKAVVRGIKISDGTELAVYTAGTVPSNPSEMLSGRRMRSLIEQMGKHYDYVVVDSAPVLPVSDSVALSRFVDGVIVVAELGRVAIAEVAETAERLNRVSAPILGFVVNKASESGSDVYAYGGYGGVPVNAKAADAKALHHEDPMGETIFSDA